MAVARMDTDIVVRLLTEIVSRCLQDIHEDWQPGSQGMPERYLLRTLEVDRSLYDRTYRIAMICYPESRPERDRLYDRILDIAVPYEVFDDARDSASGSLPISALRYIAQDMVIRFYHGIPVGTVDNVNDRHSYNTPPVVNSVIDFNSRIPPNNVDFDSGPPPSRETPNHVAHGLQRRVTYRMEVRNEREELDRNDVHNALRTDGRPLHGEGGQIAGGSSGPRTAGRKIRIRK